MDNPNAGRAPVKPLTERQETVFRAIRSYMKRRGIPPTRSELAREAGLNSAAAVAGHLTALERKGYIEILPETQRGLRVVTPGEVPILDTVYTCQVGEPLVNDSRIVAICPEIISAGIDPYPHFFMVLGDNAPNLSGLKPGAIIAVRTIADLETYEFHLVRLDNRILCRYGRAVGDGEISLEHADAEGLRHQTRIDPTIANFRIEGAVVGVLRGAVPIRGGPAETLFDST